MGRNAVFLVLALLCLGAGDGPPPCGGEDVVAQSGWPTPATSQGPYYPGAEAFVGLGNDLNPGGRARGTLLIIEGSVHDVRGAAVGSAEIEIWQADDAGRYRYPVSAPTSDAGFCYFGRAVTDEQGNFFVRTIKPPRYPAGDDWWRSAHVHMRVKAPGRPAFTTEMHFVNDVYIGDDRYLKARVPGYEALQARLELRPYAWNDEEAKRALVARFPIVLPDAP